MTWYAGVDWGSGAHAVCVIDERGERVTQFEIRHDAAGLAELTRALGKFGANHGLRIAIERPSGLLIDTLVEAGCAIVPIHPNIVKACRPRYRAAGGKSDRGDAYLLADLLRTDGHRLRALAPECDEIRALRALVRTRDDLVAERIALANQLRALLESFWPGAAAIFAEIDSPIALAFIERYPTPASTARLGAKRLAGFLAAHGYSGRKPTATLLARLHVAALPDGQLVMSFPRAGRLNAAQLLSELGSVRERFATEDQLAAEAGVCPVTYQSGKSHGVAFRWACNHRLRRALTTWADNSRHACPWAAAVYQRARTRGARHPHAVRILARAWVRVLWRAWQQHATYDPAKHRAAQRLAA